MSEFKKNEKQIEAINLLGGPQKHTFLYGGSRSSKTFTFIYAMIVRGSKAKSRHVILREHFNHAKTSIWMDTLPKVLQLCFPDLPVRWNKSDYFITLPNGTEIWIGGLDDVKRVEKILGKEYSTIFFNECSQLQYTSVAIALTRLAEKNDLINKAFYDANPPSKKHWLYWLFIKKVNPIESEPLEKPHNYQSMLMNPIDNLENIDPEYLDMLKSLPEKERNRFLHGVFNESDDGLAYYAFSAEKHVDDTIRKGPGTLYIGMDFNVMPMTATISQVVNGCLHVFDEVFLENSDTFKMSSTLLRKGYSGQVIPDSTGKNRKTSGKSDHQILKDNGFAVMTTRNPFVTDRVNNINRLLDNGKIKIHPRCKKLINDLNKVSWKDNKLDQKSDPMLTHISDCIGYTAWKLMPISDSSPGVTIIKR